LIDRWKDFMTNPDGGGGGFSGSISGSGRTLGRGAQPVIIAKASAMRHTYNLIFFNLSFISKSLLTTHLKRSLDSVKIQFSQFHP
jgi:hypothetical protein